MKKFLIDNGVQFDGDYIKIPSGINRIKIDVGLADDALHSNIWLGSEHNPIKDTIVFGFEPDPRNVRSIKNSEVQSKRKIPYECINDNFFLLPCALGDIGISETEVTYFYQHKTNPDSSSCYLPKTLVEEYEDEEEINDSIKEILKDSDYTRISVPIFSLNHFLKYIPWHKIPIIDYLKINTNGNDQQIIKGTSLFLNKIAFITFNGSGEYKSFNNIYDTTYLLNKEGFVENNGKIKLMKSFNTDPTFYNKNLEHIIKSRMISYYQIYFKE